MGRKRGREGEERRKAGRSSLAGQTFSRVYPARLREEGDVNSPVRLGSC